MATYLFYSSRASLLLFLVSCLDYLISNRIILSGNSPSTEHYFHYYPVDEDEKATNLIGVMLHHNSKTAVSNTETPQTTIDTFDKRIVLNIYVSIR